MQVSSFRCGPRRVFLFCLVVCAVGPLSGCTSKAVTEKPIIVEEKPKPPTSVPMWLGNTVRQMLGSAISQGDGPLDYANVIQRIEAWAGVEVGDRGGSH